MSPAKLDWKPQEAVAAGKGATLQKFLALSGGHKLEIDVAAWGEGHLRVDGQELAIVHAAKDRRQAFRELSKIAARFLRDGSIPRENAVRDY
jgi:hypothetical protein